MRVIEQSATILDWSGLDLYQRVETAARVCRRSESKGDAEGFVRSLIRKGHFPVLEFARVRFNSLEGYQKFDWVNHVRHLRDMAAPDNPRSDDRAFAQARLAIVAAKYPAFADGVDIDAPAPCRGIVGEEQFSTANDWIPVLFVTSRTMSHQLVRYRHDITFCQESQRHVRYDKYGIDVIEPPGLGRGQRWYAWDRALYQAEDAYRYMLQEGATAEQARAVLPGCTATRILAYASPDEWRHIFSQRCDRHADPQMSALMRPLQEQMKERGLI